MITGTIQPTVRRGGLEHEHDDQRPDHQLHRARPHRPAEEALPIERDLTKGGEGDASQQPVDHVRLVRTGFVVRCTGAGPARDRPGVVASMSMANSGR